ncbi:uncharacterized protein A1O9_00398 [Exophiala aquamarina CBS 119918]|uniref:J domain-containing protein n=1 Tax=Exophiala aquamarina CBS 119918 TaxID=1182545 RepID=A0A072PRC5_9EURO|nr:uncharacterized protein A1O9_00398 [Exophiala aquamarina CBS 119918]KEF62426.1 hypothetical protein A1O9_00398 [Exophiala aquamarina CBS 119918]
MSSTLLKKARLPAGYNAWHCCSCSHANTSPRKRLKSEGPGPSQSRTYADASFKQHEFRDNMNWPCRATPFTPTPYEIFDITKNGVYSKHKFLELVKIYHPDRSGHATELSHIERLERYRLVVQAHEILSDPVKRRAFDASGAGWGTRNNASRHSRGFTNPEGKPYGYGAGHDSSIFQNATWEDWERWYRRQDNSEKQAYSGTYIHPNAFASFVILLAVLSGVLQATRAGQYSGTLEEKARAFTEETSRFLNSRADHFKDNQVTRDGRVTHFLQKRDPSKYGLKAEEGEVYRKHFDSGLQPSPVLKSSDAG